MRDIKERGREVADVRKQYFDTVLPMHNQHIAPTIRYADLIIKGNAPIESSIRTVSRFIHSIR